MKRFHHFIILIIIVLLVVVGLFALQAIHTVSQEKLEEIAVQEEIDAQKEAEHQAELSEKESHEDQVIVDDGVNDTWITPEENVSSGSLSKIDFVEIDGIPTYIGTQFKTIFGIDVSEYQGEIDWCAVKHDNIDFAYIRVGGRGYGEKGILYPDSAYQYNIEEALANDIDVGVYFFSQAVTEDEAVEEAKYVLDLIKDYDITLPIIFDWERVDYDDCSRTLNTDSETVNKCARAFCDEIKSNGYESGIYFNKQDGYYIYDLEMFAEDTLWGAVLNTYPDFYYDIDIWQFTFTGSVDGVNSSVDMNMMFIPKQ